LALGYKAPPIWLECGALGTWPEEDIPLLLAEADQTSWVNQLTQILHGEIDRDEFEINEHNYRFGHWLEGDKLLELKTHASNSELDTALAQLPELNRQHSQLIEILHSIQLQVQRTHKK
jgi:hypothetical protein